MLSESELTELEQLQRAAYGVDARPLTSQDLARLAELDELRLSPAQDHEHESALTDEPKKEPGDRAPEPPVLDPAPKSRRRTCATALLGAGLGVAVGVALTLVSQSALSPSTPTWALEQPGNPPNVTSSYEFVVATHNWDDPATLGAPSISDDVIAWAGTMNDGADYCVAFHDLRQSRVELECRQVAADAYPLTFEWSGADQSRMIRVSVDSNGGLRSSDLPTD